MMMIGSSTPTDSMMTMKDSSNTIITILTNPGTHENNEFGLTCQEKSIE